MAANFDKCNGMMYTVKQGDTLYSISRAYKVPLALVLRANPYVDVYNLIPGDTICIPVDNLTSGNVGRPSGNVTCTNIPVCMPSDRPQVIPIPTPYEMDEESTGERNVGGVSADEMEQANVFTEKKTGERGDISKNAEMDNAEESATDVVMEERTDVVRYVTQPGDTLQDILDRSVGGMEDFWKRNTPNRTYMLPGVPYYIIEK